MGKLPPPYIGPAVATQIILNSNLKDKFELIHLDISDHRDINTLGKWDFTNFYLVFKQYFNLIRLLIKHKPGLVYIPVGQTTVSYCRDSVFILLSKLFGRKVLCHLRGGNFKKWYNSSNEMVKWWVRFVHRKVDGQIVLGNNLRHLFNFLLPEEKIFVVPNGGNYIFPSLPKREDNIQVLYLGNFISTKGIFDVLKAAAIINEREDMKNINIMFLFAGSWRDNEVKKEFERMLEEHSGLPVRVLGPVTGEEKCRVLASSDIFVFPTYFPPEGHPWVIVEAMAAGLPIISTDHGAIAESVIHNENGFIIEKRSPIQIAEKIQYLSDHPEIRKRMGNKSRQFYLANFTEEKMVERLMIAFHSVLKT